MKWHFRPYAPGEKTRDPIQGEFFATDAIRNPAEALIREGIQNSLDAQLKNDDGELASLPWVSCVAEFHQPQRVAPPVPTAFCIRVFALSGLCVTLPPR